MEKNVVGELRELLGSDVLLLHCKRGTKIPSGRWRELTLAKMSDPKYLAKLATGNIGVVLGQRSGGLCSLDIDDDGDYANFLKLNPSITDTLQTRGARGANLWLRMRGSYPPLTPLKLNGEKWGEWRSDGGQTIIWGKHPSGCDYKMLNRVKPRLIVFDEIVWPQGMNVPALLPNVTERTEHTEKTESSELTEPSERIKEYRSGNEVQAIGIDCVPAIEGSLPAKENENHHQLFQLARLLKAVQLKRGTPMELEEKRQAFSEWLENSRPYLKEGMTDDDYWFEFLEADENARHPLGINVPDLAWERSGKCPLPREAMQFQTPEVRRLVSLCRELWRLQNFKPFFLSCRTVQRLFKLSAPMTASRWLEGLKRSKILDITEKGNKQTNRATRFKYLPPVE